MWLKNTGVIEDEPNITGFSKETKMQVKVKKLLPNAVLPQRMTDGAAGFDLTAASEKFRAEKTGPVFEYDTGLSFEIPPGYVGLLFPRSSITTKTNFMLGNCVGVLDSDYRGPVKFQFRNVTPAGKKYDIGDRIGQIIVLPVPEVEFLEGELSDSVRGEGGYGSTGK